MMTDEELAPFVGRVVAVSLTTGQTVTGTLARETGHDAYALHSIDGETPPIALTGALIASIAR